MKNISAYASMKLLMLKQKVIRSKLRVLVKAPLLITTLVLMFSSGASIPLVSAQSLQQQINTLQQQNNQSQQTVNSLRVEANGLQETINGLQQLIDGLQNEIRANEAKKADLEHQIQLAEEELAKQRSVLGQNIKAMYLEGQITTLEMLASSKDLSDFVDKQQYRNSVQNKIKDTLDKINALKHQLTDQKEQVERLIKEKEAIQSQIISQKAEQDRLLGLNQGQQSTVNQDIKSNFAKIAELKRQQAIENARLFGGSGGVLGGGGYPWGSAPCIHTGLVEGACPNYDWAVGGSIYNWETGGYGFRNCTDWVAFRVRVAGGYAPSGLGNANNGKYPITKTSDKTIIITFSSFSITRDDNHIIPFFHFIN